MELRRSSRLRRNGDEAETSVETATQEPASEKTEDTAATPARGRGRSRRVASRATAATPAPTGPAAAAAARHQESQSRQQSQEPAVQPAADAAAGVHPDSKDAGSAQLQMSVLETSGAAASESQAFGGSSGGAATGAPHNSGGGSADDSQAAGSVSDDHRSEKDSDSDAEPAELGDDLLQQLTAGMAASLRAGPGLGTSAGDSLEDTDGSSTSDSSASGTDEDGPAGRNGSAGAGPSGRRRDEDWDELLEWAPEAYLPPPAAGDEVVDGLAARAQRGLHQQSKQRLAPPQDARRAAREAAKARPDTAGRGWFDLPATTITPQVKQDLRLLALRGAFDPKRFYRKADATKFPKYFQFGTVVEGPTDFYSSRMTRKERKQTLTEELLADSQLQAAHKRRFGKLQAERGKWAGVKKRKTSNPRLKKKKPKAKH